MREREYAFFEKELFDCCKTTIMNSDLELSDTNFVGQLEALILSVIKKNNYEYFPNFKNARRRMMKFPQDVFVNLVKSRVSEYGMGNLDNIEQCVHEYVMKIVPRSLPSDYYRDDDVYYSLSNNKCREALLSGKMKMNKFTHFKVAGMQSFSDVGKVRKNQEDSYYIGVHPKNPDFKIMLVADGMGGHEAGEIASNIAAKEMLKWFEELSPSVYDSSFDASVFDKIASRIVLLIDKEIERLNNGAGTTLCFAINMRDNIYICNVGDSRGFVFEDGKPIYQTKMDNFPAKIGVPDEFNRFHSKSNVLAFALGQLKNSGSYFVKGTSINKKKGKKYQVVLCSDGVSDCLSDEKINDVANSNSDNVAYDLVNLALNSNSSFKEELHKSEVKAGIIGRFSYRKLVKLLGSFGMGKYYDKEIEGGKDNTTAVYGEFGRGRR